MVLLIKNDEELFLGIPLSEEIKKKIKPILTELQGNCQEVFLSKLWRDENRKNCFLEKN